MTERIVKAFLREVQNGVLPNQQELYERLHIQYSHVEETAENLVMCTNSNGDTPFLTAARSGHLHLLETLYAKHGVPLEHTNADGKTALHEAAQGGQFECVRYLLQSGAHVDSLKKADWTPLMLACTKENLAVVEALVDSGASLSLVNKDGWTPFHIACREGHCDVIKYLVDASPSCWNTKSKNGRTPLHTAALHGRLGAVRMLLERCSYEVDSGDSSGVTPLMDACRGNHVEVAQCLLCHTKDSLEQEDLQGHQAVHHAAQAGATDAIQLLLAKGVCVNALTGVTGQTALHCAAKEGHAEALSQLLSLGADPRLTDKTGKTALDVARYARDSQAAMAVLEKALATSDKTQHPRISIQHLSPQNDFRVEMGRDVRIGLTSQPMRIPSKYHYDKIGSVLFEEITRLPEYYVTRTETEIIEQQAKDIMKLVVPDELVELGSGSSTKTRLLLEAMHCTGGNRYVPLEISETALYQAAEALNADYEWLEIEGYIGNYVTDLPHLPRRGRRLIVFLGTSLGNCMPTSRRELLQQIGSVLKPGDALLLGIDLVKDERKMVAAYSDSLGVSARFSLNVLEIVNRELDANFDIKHFTHRVCWNHDISAIEAYAQVQQEMTVLIRALDTKLILAKGEKIYLEISCKFTREGLTAELADVGLKVVQWYSDSAAQYGLLIASPK